MLSIDHLSHSQIVSWLMCPRQWYYRKVEKIPEPLAPNLMLGSAYHSALEANFKYKMKSKDDLPISQCLDVYESAWEEQVKSRDINWGRSTPGDVRNLGSRLVTAYITTVAPTIQPKMVEQWMETEIAGVKFVIRMDLIDDQDRVIDHKTAAKAYTQNDVDKDLQASASAFVLGKSIIFYNHVAVKTANPYIQIIKTARLPGDVEWWKDMVTSIIEHMKTGYAPPRPDGWWCNEMYCSFYSRCRGGCTRL